jgi:hypothetical protein
VIAAIDERLAALEEGLRRAARDPALRGAG